MEKELDELLRHALTPMEEPDSRLNQKILSMQQAKQIVRPSGQTGANMDKEERKKSGFEMIDGYAGTGADRERKKRRRIPAAAAAAILAGAVSLSAAAAYRYLTWQNVAEEAGDDKLAEAIASESGSAVDETQICGGYSVTLMGIISGEGISDYVRTGGGGEQTDRTYAAVAIRRADGTPIEPSWAEENDFFVSPLIGGYDPAFYNAASMHGDYTEFLEDGTLYRLVGCDNVEIFADHGLYLCVSEGSFFYNRDAYLYDPETGAISRNEEYEGLNALFELPLDTSAADPEKALAYMEGLGIKAPEADWDARKAELEDGFRPEAAEGHEKGAQAAEYALQFVGNPYAWGGESLTEGCDSSGFTKGVFAYLEVDLPHGARQQRACGEEVQGLEKALPGDLIFYEEPSHVAVYIGDGKIVHADTQYGICVSEAEYMEIAEIRRIL